MKQKYKGILCIIASSCSFGLMNVFIRLAGDLPSMQKSFFRNLVAFFFAYLIMRRKGIPFSCKKENRKDIRSRYQQDPLPSRRRDTFLFLHRKFLFYIFYYAIEYKKSTSLYGSLSKFANS